MITKKKAAVKKPIIIEDVVDFLKDKLMDEKFFGKVWIALEGGKIVLVQEKRTWLDLNNK